MFSIISNLKLKRAASEHSLPPILPKLEWEGIPVTCSTKPGSFSTLGSLHLSFGGAILFGSVCVVGGIITSQLISWYVSGSQNTEVFIKRSSNDNLFLTGNGIRDGIRGKLRNRIRDKLRNRIRDKLRDGIRDVVGDGIRDVVGDGIRDVVGDGIRGEVCWGNLPQEMWGEIGKRMVSRLDIVSFRSVCKKWRSSLSSPTGRFPLLLPPLPTCDPEFRNMPYAISEVNIYRSLMGTAMLQVDQGGIFYLIHELSLRGDKADFDGASLRALPCRLRTRESRMKDPDFYYSDSCLSFTAFSFFTKVYYPCMALDSHKIRHERKCSEFPKKLVLISSSNVNPIYARMSDLSVVAHLGGEGRLALLRLGGPPENWVWDTDFCSQVFVNIATYEGKLCTLDRCGKVFLMDYNSLQMTQVCASLSVPFELEGKSLFEACGDLYLVDFAANTSYRFDAYKLSLPLQKWLRVEGMGSCDFIDVSPFLL